MKKSSTKKNGEPTAFGWGGARQRSGRKKTGRVQVTCFLRRDTIAELRAAGGRRWSEYLQAHLDRYPLPGVLEKIARSRPSKRWNLRKEKDAKAFDRMFTRALRQAKNDDTRKIKQSKPVADSVR